MAKVDIPDSLKEKAKQEGLNLSALFARLSEMLEEENEAVKWSLELQKSSRKNRLENLKKEGFV